MKFYTELLLVDVDTGEIINKSTYERENYYKTGKLDIKYQKNGDTIIKTICHECRRTKQTKLFD